jgi:hypothetical protein
MSLHFFFRLKNIPKPTRATISPPNDRFTLFRSRAKLQDFQTQVTIQGGILGISTKNFMFFVFFVIKQKNPQSTQTNIADSYETFVHVYGAFADVYGAFADVYETFADVYGAFVDIFETFIKLVFWESTAKVRKAKKDYVKSLCETFLILR